MNNNQKDRFQTVWKQLTRFFQSEKTHKNARVTYQVIWNLTLILIIVGILGFSFAGGVGAGYFAALVNDEPVRSKEDLKKDIYNYEETSEVYFADEVYLGKLKSDLEREEVSIDKVSEHLKNAVIATEDEYFYEHDGVVPKAILRAIYQEFSNATVQSGGSTLTQQLIKNQVLTNEVSFERKAKEILLALRVEKFFEKEEILETYLNVSTLGRNSSGRNIAGVESAAEGIFGVEAKDLTLPQSAFIAGLPQSPFGYTPYTQKGKLKENQEPGINRMKTVLKRMYSNGYITKEEYDKAVAYDITKDFIGKTEMPSEKYPWLTYEIEKRSIEILSVSLAKDDGYEEKDLKNDDLKAQYLALADRKLRQNGYQIYTTIDKKIYDKMQEVTKNYPNYGYDKTAQVVDPDTKEMKTVSEPVEAGAILIENKTGKIISFVGGRDFKREQTNHATASLRSNGSTMKPLLVYGPGIELGKISPGSVSANVPISIPAGKMWRPGNYGGGSYTGVTTAREALKNSYNIPAALFYMKIINQGPASYLEKMGFTTVTKEDYSNAAMSLGAMSKGVTVEENVNAFGTFANSGEFIDAYMIDKIVSKDGKVIYEHKAKPVEVFSPQAAYLTLDMMRDVVNSGTAASVRNRLAFSSDWAGKTGTSQNYSDAWFVATNPNVSFGTWLGYDTPKSLQGTYNGLEYNKRNMYYWADLINAAYKVDPKLIDPDKRFEMPGGIVSRSFCGVSGLLPSSSCQKAGLVKSDLFIAKYAPTKADDSFIDGQYVSVGSKRYAALPQTPGEFTSGGFMLNPDSFADIGLKYVDDPGSVIPGAEKSGNVVGATAKLNDNGKAPDPLSITIGNDKITWGLHDEGDVVGYRVYKDGKKVASINAGENLVYKVGSGGSYYVTAVDIVGKESAPSQRVESGAKKTGSKEDSTKTKDDRGKDKLANEDKKSDSKEENASDKEKEKEPVKETQTDKDKEPAQDKEQQNKENTDQEKQETDKEQDTVNDKEQDTDKAEEEEE
ncbi:MULTISPECIES: transglycosylase domain-containing protein [Peribacillus]|uniref:transglycosylase domain-containing protein n=1 Tax=Peribacillus TaxID=2675229 RepID=UPI001F4EB290|nr:MULTISPECIES: transglycosylase domain-containing protein [unclassified Peribacillus]MCK1981703.1 transglycosylase domain-containing protein [Peribacillus sp. Aquil_B1]MCK2009575.1 transglycosylase domain-containing protein [Peribacillus sp. Aquil_B8]